jgi:hypothetical protein
MQLIYLWDWLLQNVKQKKSLTWKITGGNVCIDVLSTLRNSLCVYLKYLAQSRYSDAWGRGEGGCLTASLLWVSQTQHCVVNDGCKRAITGTNTRWLIDDSYDEPINNLI